MLLGALPPMGTVDGGARGATTGTVRLRSQWKRLPSWNVFERGRLTVSTYDLRRLAARVQNAQIRLNDIAHQLIEAGYPAEGSTGETYGRMIGAWCKRLNHLADLNRDPRGTHARTTEDIDRIATSEAVASVTRSPSPDAADKGDSSRQTDVKLPSGSAAVARHGENAASPCVRPAEGSAPGGDGSEV